MGIVGAVAVEEPGGAELGSLVEVPSMEESVQEPSAREAAAVHVH